MDYPFVKDIHHCWLVSSFTLKKTQTVLKNTLPTSATINAEARYLKGESNRKRARAVTAAARLPGVVRDEGSSDSSTSPHPLLRAPSRIGAKSAQA